MPSFTNVPMACPCKELQSPHKFFCTAHGKPLPFFEWTKNGKILPQTTNKGIIKTNHTDPYNAMLLFTTQ